MTSASACLTSPGKAGASSSALFLQGRPCSSSSALFLRGRLGLLLQGRPRVFFFGSSSTPGLPIIVTTPGSPIIVAGPGGMVRKFISL